MNPWGLITGASSGIGWELAHCLARRRINLVVTARRRDRLEALAHKLSAEKIEVRVLDADLSAPGSAAALWRRVEDLGLPVEILINNAAFGLGGRFAALPLAEQTEMVQLNIVSLMELTWLFLRPRLTTGSGRVLNVASTAAFEPGPQMAVYYASKAFVLSFSEALSYELRNTGVTVTALCPGLTRTEFGRRAKIQDSVWSRLFSARADRVAETGCRALLAGRRRVIHGWPNRLGAALAQWAPRSWALNFVGAIQKSRQD